MLIAGRGVDPARRSMPPTSVAPCLAEQPRSRSRSLRFELALERRQLGEAPGSRRDAASRGPTAIVRSPRIGPRPPPAPRQAAGPRRRPAAEASGPAALVMCPRTPAIGGPSSAICRSLRRRARSVPLTARLCSYSGTRAGSSGSAACRLDRLDNRSTPRVAVDLPSSSAAPIELASCSPGQPVRDDYRELVTARPGVRRHQRADDRTGFLNAP